MWRASGRKYQMKRDRRKETENKMKKVYEKPQETSIYCYTNGSSVPSMFVS